MQLIVVARIGEPHADDVPVAGEARVYTGNCVCVLVALVNNTFFLTYMYILSTAKSVRHQDMIHERVLTQGIMRPLEPECELPAP